MQRWSEIEKCRRRKRKRWLRKCKAEFKIVMKFKRLKRSGKKRV